MRQHRLVCLFARLIAVGLLCFLASDGATAKQQRTFDTTKWIPDEHHRQQARYLRADDVARIEFGGEELAGSQPDGVVVVDDLKLIARFVLALREAEELAPLPALPGISPQYFDSHAHIDYDNGHIDLFLKPNSLLLTRLPKAFADKETTSSPYSLFGENEKGKYLRFAFSPGEAATCFGPHFWSALHVLSKYQTERIRRIVSAVKAQVVAFRCTPYESGSPTDPAATDPAEVAAFVNALCHANEQVYHIDFHISDEDVTAYPTATELVLRDGRKIPLVLMPIGSLSHPKQDPEWLRTLLKLRRYLAPPESP